MTARIGEFNALSSFGGLLLHRGEFKNVRKFCEKMFRQLPENHPDRAVVYNNWGCYHLHEGKYDEALESYLIANTILHSLPPKYVDPAVQVMTYSNIGAVND
ncbi:unnamed protein product, partial [Rotaria sordida]